MKKPRDVIILGDIAIVRLTKGFEAIIDSDDAGIVENYCWSSYVRDRTVYAGRTIKSECNAKCLYLHRAIMNPPGSMQVDHINGNGLDNRKINLRIATSQQNNHNQRMRKDNKSGYKGVSWSNTAKAWKAQIRLFGKTINLGFFDCPKSAYEIYCDASIKLHKDFGRRN